MNKVKRITLDEKLERASIAYDLRNGPKQLTLSQIGRILSISPSRVDQILWWYKVIAEEYSEKYTKQH